jgi:hypothetical protein
MSDGLPIRTSGPADMMRVQGLQSLGLEASHSAPRHPVMELQRSQENREWMVKLDNARRMYGSHMAMRLASEKALLSRPHRLPGLVTAGGTGSSSCLGRDVALGLDTSIDFSDFLDGIHLPGCVNCISYHPCPCAYYACLLLCIYTDPRTRPAGPRVALHDVMEARLGLI